ncbi:DUF4861 family protein [Pedobacter sp.]|uniref:DUF4861 family protein n=1 Tax=Pedobacter sp. TaxID=1411316 RepID=UPI003D7FD49F
MNKNTRFQYLSNYKLLLILVLLCCSMAVSAATSIEIVNPLSQKRKELVEIPFEQFQKGFLWTKGKTFKLINATTKAEVAYQLAYKGNAAPVALLIAVDIAAKGILKITVVAGKPAVVKAQTFARYVPERYDDFAWENDKVAFRMYGAALENRKDNAMGMDVWSKRTAALVVDKWYKTEDYHADHGEGMDYYSVGNTLGGGDIAPFIKDSIYFTNNYKTWKVLDNGPLRSTFQLTYPTRNAANIPYTVTKIISIDAGSQLNKVEAIFDYQGTEALPLAIGIVKRDQPGATVVLNEKSGIMAYWEPDSEKTGVTGLAVLVADNSAKMDVAKGHLLTLVNTKAAQPYVYYNGAAWDRAGKITSAQAWVNYLADFKAALNAPLKVSLK